MSRCGRKSTRSGTKKSRSESDPSADPAFTFSGSDLHFQVFFPESFWAQQVLSERSTN